MTVDPAQGGQTPDLRPQAETIRGIQERIRELRDLRDVAAVGSSEFRSLASEISRLETRLLSIQGRGNAARVASGSGRASSTTSEAERYLQSLQRQLEAMDELTEREQLLRDISLGRLGQVNAAQRGQLIAIAEAIDLRRQEEEADRERLATIEMLRQAVIEEAQVVQAANEQWERMLQTLVADTAIEKTRRLNEQIQVLDEALQIGRISAEQYAEAMAKITETAPEIAKTSGLVDDLGLTFTSAFEDAIAKGGALSDVLKGVEQDMLRLVTRKLVTEPLGNFLTGALGRIIPSFDGGGFTGSGARMGGLDGRGGYIAMLHPNETVIDHTKGGTRAGNRPISVVNHFTLQGNPSRQTQVQLAAAVQKGLAAGSRNL